ENQLLHSSNYRLVVRSIDSKRRVFTAFLVSIGLYCLVMALFAIRAGEAPVFSGGTAGLFGFWAWVRIRRIRALYRALAEYLEVIPEEDIPDSFGKELQLGFRLEYSDYQLIRAGRDGDVASNLIHRRVMNAIQFLVFGTLFGFSQSGFAWSLDRAHLVSAILGFLFAAIPFGICVAIECHAIYRIRRLVEKYDHAG
ncbi:MAG: hypothetical protein AAFU85_20630, partial [Planctomycetota bacterium]